MSRAAPDAVAIVRGAVAARMPDVPFATTVPKADPDGPMVVCWVQSALRADFLYRPVVALQCWGPSDALAMALAQDCALAVDACARDHPLLSKSELQSLSRDQFAPGGPARYRLLLQLYINE